MIFFLILSVYLLIFPQCFLLILHLERFYEQLDVNDIPDQHGRVALVTGANSGLGLETTRALAAHGAHVIMATCNPDKGRREEAEIKQTVPGLSSPPAFDRGLVPVAAQQRAAGPLPGDAAHERQQACIIPGYGLSVAGSVHGHRAIRQHVARVHEQRAPIHATPSFPRRETLPAPSQPRDGSRQVARFPATLG